MKSNRSSAGFFLSTLLASLLLVACGETPEAMLLSAKGYMAKNDTKAAVIQIKNALQSNPDLHEARFLLGRALLDSGDAAGAETEFRKALDLKHPLDDVIPLLAKALLAQGQAKKVTDDLTQYELTSSAAKASFQTTVAFAYAQQQKGDLSEAALNAALVADSAYLPALLAQAKQRAVERDFEGSMKQVDAILVASPTSAEAWTLKGDLFLYGNNQEPQALAAYRKAIEVKPDYLMAQASLISILLKQANLADAIKQLDELKKIAPGSPQTKYLEAQLAFQKKDFKQSRDLVQQVLKAAPSNVQALQLAGAVEFELKAPLQAEAYLSKALKSAPQLATARRLLVMTYLRSGQPAKALATLLPGLEKPYFDPELLSVAGEVYLQSGDIKKAEEYFALASKQAPQDVRKRTSLALAHMLGGQVDASFVELQNIANTDSGITAELALISAYLRRDEVAKALNAIDSLEKKQPKNPLASYLRARTLLSKKDLAGAKKNFDLALTVDADYFPAVVGLADLDMLEKNPGSAKKRFEAVLAKSPANVQALQALSLLAGKSAGEQAEISKRINSAVAVNPTNVASQLMLINHYLRIQDFKAANTAAQAAVTLVPDSPELLDALGLAQQAAGELNQAIATFIKLTALQPLSPQPQLRLAGAHLAANNKDAYANGLRKALDLKPDLIEAQRALVLVDLGEKRVREALTTAQTVQKQRPNETIGYLLEGDIYAFQKNWEPAVVAYRNGLKKVNSSDLAMKIYSVFLASGKSGEAEKFSTTWMRDNPKDVSFLLYMGETGIALKDYVAAEKSFSAAIKVQPNNAVAYNNLAWVTGRLNKVDAIGLAEKANALAPNQPAFMDTLAMLLSDKGDYAKAVELQGRVVQLQPDNRVFKMNLAKIHIKGGNKAAAKTELEELAKLGEKFAGQSEVTSLLKSL